MPPRPYSRRILSTRPSWTESNSICPSCIQVFRRPYTSQVVAAVDTTVLETTASSPKVAHRLCASVILSRPPQITQDLRPFQKAFYLYQRRLNERTTLPFTELFYYKEGTPDIIDYQRKIKERKTPARDIGSYDAIGEEGWHDEVLVGAPESEMDYQLEQILKDEVVEKREGVKDTSDPTKTAVNAKPMPRVTEADEKGDEKSLDRMLQRTLYLLVKNKDELWQFPTAPLDGKESLRAAASRILEQAAGVDMNSWIVGNHPVGHFKLPYSEQQVKLNDQGHHQGGDIVFFMKGRILAGQANLIQNSLGAKDFKWLTKEEIQPIVRPKYWKSIQDVLPER